MLLKLLEHLRKENIHLYHQKGVVVENEDPKKLGRVKCTIKNRWEEGDTKKLPWVFPLSPFFLGGCTGLGITSVPEITTELIIIFPFEDEYSPFYVGYWQNENTKNILIEEDYPESWGISDSTPQWFRVNKKKPYAEYYNSLENLIHFDENGNVLLNIPKSLIVKIGETLNLKIEKSLAIKAGGGSILNSGAGVSIQTDGNHCVEAGGNITSMSGGITELKSSSDAGINAAGLATVEGSGVDINGGVIIGAVDGDVGSLDDLLGELDSKISDLDSKLSELKTLADNLKSSGESAKTAIGS
jgi:hypothetical protein